MAITNPCADCPEASDETLVYVDPGIVATKSQGEIKKGKIGNVSNTSLDVCFEEGKTLYLLGIPMAIDARLISVAITAYGGATGNAKIGYIARVDGKYQYYKDAISTAIALAGASVQNLGKIERFKDECSGQIRPSEYQLALLLPSAPSADDDCKKGVDLQLTIAR